MGRTGGMPMLKVDLDALRALGTALTDTADTVGSLDPVAPIVAAADAMPNSAFGDVARSAAMPTLAAYRVVGVRIREMASASLASADSYEDTDRAFSDQLVRLNAEGR
ncbi:UDP-glucose 4-epimerase [Rhodococcus sp. IEGM 1354]|uniref:UDP-glucose 4-epimerase n=1 Tax=Rhodococcus sp. IEGM 1354 TaxID=3047088 RepID=UPI0024B71A85|nr:UDP-glucose 4-epimerase [Rhodococcus sp. IEGM 1354]MDI9933248.1 UDP-glucose 4-epimerase [Rhodococcus sp. IEGM 1354]